MLQKTFLFAALTRTTQNSCPGYPLEGKIIRWDNPHPYHLLIEAYSLKKYSAYQALSVETGFLRLCRTSCKTSVKYWSLVELNVPKMYFAVLTADCLNDHSVVNHRAYYIIDRITDVSNANTFSIHNDFKPVVV